MSLFHASNMLLRLYHSIQLLDSNGTLYKGRFKNWNLIKAVRGHCYAIKPDFECDFEESRKCISLGPKFGPKNGWGGGGSKFEIFQYACYPRYGYWSDGFLMSRIGIKKLIISQTKICFHEGSGYSKIPVYHNAFFHIIPRTKALNVKLFYWSVKALQKKIHLKTNNIKLVISYSKKIKFI